MDNNNAVEDEKMDTGGPLGLDIQPTPEQQRKDDIDVLTGVVRTFMMKSEKWSMSNIVPAFRQMAEQLHTQEARQGRAFIQNNYIALELMPAVIYYITSKLFAELPDSCKLVEERQEAFVLALLALIDPSSPRGLTFVQNFDNLLNADNDAQWIRALHDDIAMHLRSTAQKRLAHYTDRLAELSTDAERAQYAEAYEKEHPEFDGQRLYEIASGHFPAGFNTFEEQRYAYFDMRYLLFPGVDVKCQKEISPETNAYLLRAAAEMVDQEAQRPDQNIPLMNHLQALLTRGHPEGYTVQPTSSSKFQEF